jgi:hypothetical protein
MKEFVDVQGELEVQEVEAGELVLMKNFGACRCGALCFMANYHFRKTSADDSGRG